jgi:8-amino-7-oxononanoate synthase
MENPEGLFSADSFFLQELEKRKAGHLFRQWSAIPDPARTDFISNDYLGLSRMARQTFTPELLDWMQTQSVGSTGSRLVSGQSEALENLEAACRRFFKSESCLFFQNGYLANLALLSTVASRNDTFLYDEQCHVSLKDGMRLSLARRFPFRHNDMEDLSNKLSKATGKVFIVTESIFSMEGDVCPVGSLVNVAERFGAHIIIDEAHSTGTYGKGGKGLCLEKGIEKKIWARIYTFGKALGASGAVLAISHPTLDYLINFSHPVIYSTAPMPVHAALCQKQLENLENMPWLTDSLQEAIRNWNSGKPEGSAAFSGNERSPVQYFQVGENKKALRIAEHLQNLDIQTKAMLSPTVPPGSERIRISLHAFNSPIEIENLIRHLQEF